MHTGNTLREYALESASEGGLHELARIPFDGSPDNVFSDEERAAIVVEDVDTHSLITKGVYVCRKEATGWQQKEVTLKLDKRISIRCWTRLDETRLAINDNSDENVQILEYV